MAKVREQAPELRRADGSPIRVLVVDDEATLADLLSMALRYEGWDIRTAGDGGTAVRVFRDFRPDAVVLDVRSSEIVRWVQENFPATTVGGRTVYDLTRPLR